MRLNKSLFFRRNNAFYIIRKLLLKIIALHLQFPHDFFQTIFECFPGSEKPRFDRTLRYLKHISNFIIRKALDISQNEYLLEFIIESVYATLNLLLNVFFFKSLQDRRFIGRGLSLDLSIIGTNRVVYGKRFATTLDLQLVQTVP